MKKIMLICGLAALLSACGGGGSSATPSDNSTAEGFYTGTTGDGRTIAVAVMPNGTYYALYSRRNLSSVIGGFAQGFGSSNNGSFSSSNGTDFNFEGLGAYSVTVSASYRDKTSISGSISASGSSSSFAAVYSSEYEKNPSLSTLAGTYAGTIYDLSGNATATIQIKSDGIVTGNTSSGCSITGVVDQAVKGNAYALGLSLSGAGCLLQGMSFGGAVFYDSAFKSIYAAAFNTPRTYGTVFVGTKP